MEKVLGACAPTRQSHAVRFSMAEDTAARQAVHVRTMESPRRRCKGPRWRTTLLRAAFGLSLWALGAALGTTLLVPAVVHAESAEQLFEQGVQALKERRYRDAATALDASYRLQQVPKTMYHLGLAYEGMGYPDKAVEALQAYVGFADATQEKASIDAARQRIADIKASVARFSVSLDPASAVVKLDGSTVQLSDGQLWVVPGSHRISITAPDHEPFEQNIEVKPGRFELDIRLRPITDPPEIRAAKLMDEGDGRNDVGDFHGAAAKYEAAQAILPTPRGAGSMGLALEKAGALGPAEGGILEALQSPRDPWVRKHRRELRQAKARLAKKLGTLIVKGDSQYGGAAIVVNEHAVGQLPLADGGKVRAATGNVSVRATLDGYEDFTHEVFLQRRKQATVQVSMRKKAEPLPMPVVAPIAEAPAAAAPVAAAAPALTEAKPPTPEPAAEPAQPEPPPEPIVKEAYVDAARQADIELEVERYEPDEAEEEGEPATGLEMAVNLGYQFTWKAAAKSSGGLAAHLFSIGFRPVWPVSFGIQLVNAQVDPWNDSTRVVMSVNPGFYARGHIQQHKKPMAVDVWGGVGVQPLAMSLAVYKEGSLDPGNVDASMLDNVDATDVAGQLAKSQLGVSYGVTVQSWNIPLELGLDFYLTKGLALQLATAFTFWIPTQECVWDQNDHVCYDSNIKAQKSFYIGAGLSFLP